MVYRRTWGLNFLFNVGKKTFSKNELDGVFFFFAGGLYLHDKMNYNTFTIQISNKLLKKQDYFDL